MARAMKEWWYRNAPNIIAAGLLLLLVVCVGAVFMVLHQPLTCTP